MQSASQAEPVDLFADEDVALAALCRALGHPARVQILKILISEQRCLTGSLSDRLPLAPSTVSQHLKQLRDVGLIMGQIDGPRRNYCVAPQVLERLKSMIEAL